MHAKSFSDDLKHCSNLQTLNLESNSIGADGLKHCSNLQILSLEANNISTIE